MPRYYAIEIKVGGRPCHGDWRLCQGNVLQIGSAWGSATVELRGREDPKSAAQRALEKIVIQHAKDRAAELKRQERELAKLRKPKTRKPAAQ